MGSGVLAFRSFRLSPRYDLTTSDWNVQLAHCVLAVGIWAGLRPSEIAALQWQSVDLNHSPQGVRLRQREANDQDGERQADSGFESVGERNEWPESGWVFQNRDGNPVNMNILSNRIIRPNCVTHKDELDGHAFYALRYGFGTLLVHDGWSCEEVAQAMGNSVDVVWKYYFVNDKGKLAANARERGRAKPEGNNDSQTTGSDALLASTSTYLRSRNEHVGSAPNSKNSFQVLAKVGLLSPDHRFMIALLSPNNVGETGLPMVPPEKMATNTA